MPIDGMCHNTDNIHRKVGGPYSLTWLCVCCDSVADFGTVMDWELFSMPSCGLAKSLPTTKHTLILMPKSLFLGQKKKQERQQAQTFKN